MNISQLPGEVNISVTRGDVMYLTATFNVDITGRQFSVGGTLDAPFSSGLVTVTKTDAYSVRVDFTQALTDELPPTGTWTLVWADPGTGLNRTTLLAGTFNCL